MSKPPLVGVLAVVVFVGAACTRDDTAAPPGGATSEQQPSPGGPTAGQPPAPGPTGPPPTAAPPETGIPGLDSDDVFCAAWSRFAGSFQVIAVASSFLVDDARRAFELELAGSITVTDAYAALGEHWPAELARERDAALNGQLGPFATRAERARQVLAEALDGEGGGREAWDALVAAWEQMLATRNPDEPDVELAVPGDALAALTAATLAFAGAEPPLYADPALITDVETPLADAYRRANCPDEGLLAGTDVDA
ncbi:MAG TPA: hypothetical protein VNQ73_13890 [Ilumatobacter sp.]|nr:hypothetical protein [Ilumatobacter sp.]